MQFNKVNIEVPQTQPLHILTTYPDTSCKRHYLKMLQNSRYVTNFSLGLQLRPTTPHVRYKPYGIPRREERHRTKSENNENDITNMVKAVLEERIIEPCEEIAMLKKAKSLESVVTEDIHKELTEVEAVSGCIEKLRVDE